MTPQEQQAKLNDIDPEALAKIQATKGQNASGTLVDGEWLAICELGKHYGWSAIECLLPEVKEHGLSPEYMSVLLAGARKIDAMRSYTAHRAAFIGGASAQSKTPSKTFESMTRQLLKQAEADE